VTFLARARGGRRYKNPRHYCRCLQPAATPPGREFLGRYDQLNWDGFLNEAHKNDHIEMLIQVGQINLVNVFEINEQEFLIQISPQRKSPKVLG